MAAYQLDGKVALVTGGSRGIGAAVATALGSAGAAVGVNYLQQADAATQVVAAIEAAGGRALAVQGDVSLEADVQRMVGQVADAYGILNILINNAAIYKDSTVAKMDKAIWDEVLDVDLGGVFLCTKHAIPLIKQSGWGRIINISSVVGQTGIFGTASYTAAKAGIIGLTKTVAKELVRRGITVNTLSLGYFETGMNLRLAESVRQATLAQIPMGRFGTADEVAGTVLFLCSDAAGYITGQTIGVNGGYYM